MVANALLTNPALFTGVKETPTECVQKWVDICFNSGYNSTFHSGDSSECCFRDENIKPLTFQCFHHHLVFMLAKILSKKQRRIFNNLQTFESVVEFLSENLDIRPKKLDNFIYELYKPMPVNYDKTIEKYFDLMQNCYCLKEEKDIDAYDYDSTDGKYFSSIVSKVESDNDTSISDLFSET